MAHRVRHSRDAQEAETATQVWREREELLKRKGTKSSSQAETLATGVVPTQPGASASSTLPHQAHPDFDCHDSGGGIDINMNEDLLPQALVDLSKQPNSGMPTSSLDRKSVV